MALNFGEDRKSYNARKRTSNHPVHGVVTDLAELHLRLYFSRFSPVSVDLPPPRLHSERNVLPADWRKLRQEELRDLYRWAGHLAQAGDKRNAYRTVVGKLKERNHF